MFINKSDKIFEICKKLNCTHYITGSGSKDYLKIKDFHNQKIKILDSVMFQKQYDQKDEFIKDLSIMDILFWVNFEKIEINK